MIVKREVIHAEAEGVGIKALVKFTEEDGFAETRWVKFSSLWQVLQDYYDRGLQTVGLNVDYDRAA